MSRYPTPESGKSPQSPGQCVSSLTPQQSQPVSNDKEIWEYNPNWSPSVYAVLPLTDSLEFDLSSRRQRELDLAGSLAATFAAQGMTGEAKLMARYIRRRDSNVETASLLPVASSYTDGGAFGFRIYPRPQGITNPGDPYAGAGNVLQPVSFPVLVAFLCDEEGGDEKWTHLRVSTHVAWIPVRGRFSPLKKAIRFFAPNYTGGNIRSDLDLVEQAELAGLMDKAQSELQCLERSCDTDKSRTATAQLARRAFDSLRGGILGYERIAAIPTFEDPCQECPPDDSPWSVASAPAQRFFATHGTFNFIIQLNSENKDIRLNGMPRTVWIAGVEATVQGASSQKGTAVVVAEIDLARATGAVELPVAVDWGGSVIVGHLAAEFPTEKKPAQAGKSTGLELESGATLRLNGKIPVKVHVEPAAADAK